MKAYIIWILVMIASVLVGCSTQDFSPGPDGPIGPQGDLGPNDPVGPSSSDSIIIESMGNLVYEEYDFAGFEEIEIGSLMEVEISQGDRYKVTTSVEEDAVHYLQVSLVGKRLRIGLDPSQSYNTTNATLQAKITLPEFTTLIVDGISQVTLKDIQCAQSMSVEVKGISTLEGSIDGCDLNLEVFNLSKVKLSGSAENVFIKVAEISEVDLTSLDIQELDYEIDDSSDLIQNEN